MNPESSQAPFAAAFTRAVSATRFGAFRKSGSDAEGLGHYLWNIALCEAFYPTVHTLEVGFRNTVHRELGAAIGQPEWLRQHNPFLHERELASISQAEQSLTRHHKPIDEPRLVAELSFGFWTSLLDRRYERIWPRFIAKAFPNMPRRIRTRATLSSMAQPIRKLRNLAFHHHAIWDRPDLETNHNYATTIIGWISTPLAASLAKIDRFPAVFSEGPAPYVEHAASLIPHGTP